MKKRQIPSFEIYFDDDHLRLSTLRAEAIIDQLVSAGTHRLVEGSPGVTFLVPLDAWDNDIVIARYGDDE